MSCAIYTLAVLVSLTCSVYGGGRGKGTFTSYVSMEKLYTLEEELITISNVILHQEKALHGDKDVHDLYKINSTIEEAKDIHRGLLKKRQFSSYLVHPINMYHLTKRLAEAWRGVVKALDESESCAKAMKLKIQNIAENLPTKDHVTLVVDSILRLQRLYNIPADTLQLGTIAEQASLDPLSLDEMFEVARAAYANDYYNQASKWLEVLTSQYVKEKASFNLTNALNILSSCYLKLNRTSDALAKTDSVLKLDPENKAALRQQKYIKTKQASGPVPHPKGRRRERVTRQFCSGEVTVNPQNQSRLFCAYLKDRSQGLLTRPRLQVEVLRWKPFIAIFHNFTTVSQQKAVAYLGYEKMRDILTKQQYSLPEGLDMLDIQDFTVWRWITTLKEHLENLPLTNNRVIRNRFFVHNIGVDGSHDPGMFSTNYPQRDGTFLLFLTEPKHGGGEVIFPKAGTKVTPQKGSVLFYESKAVAEICPVLVDTEWVGVYPLLTIPYKSGTTMAKLSYRGFFK